MSLAQLERPSATPSMAPSQAGPAPIAPRNVGKTAVAVSWLQSLNRLVRATPRTVRLSQDCFSAASGMSKKFTVVSPRVKSAANVRLCCRSLSRVLLCGKPRVAAFQNIANRGQTGEEPLEFLIAGSFRIARKSAVTAKTWREHFFQLDACKRNRGSDGPRSRLQEWVDDQFILNLADFPSKVLHQSAKLVGLLLGNIFGELTEATAGTRNPLHNFPASGFHQKR